jgi:hypothetical protein
MKAFMRCSVRQHTEWLKPIDAFDDSGGALGTAIDHCQRGLVAPLLYTATALSKLSNSTRTVR